MDIVRELLARVEALEKIVFEAIAKEEAETKTEEGPHGE